MGIIYSVAVEKTRFVGTARKKPVFSVDRLRIVNITLKNV